MSKYCPKASLQELQKYSLLNNLKRKISSLRQVVEQQAQTIECFKRNTKTTIINEQDIQIQRLNDENKRLLLIIEDLRENRKEARKMNKNKRKGRETEERKSNTTIKRASSAMEKEADWCIGDAGKNDGYLDQRNYHLVIENEILRKKLTCFKAQENLANKKSSINDRSTILIEKSLNESDKVRQRGYELEAELSRCLQRENKLKMRVEDLEELLEKAMKINKSMKNLDTLRCL